VINLPAAFIVAALTMMLVLGTKESARLNNVMVAIKLFVVLAFIVLGAMYVNPAHWHPFIPPNNDSFGGFGLSGILRGSAVVFFAFIGFDAVSTSAQEATLPQRDMPIGILGSLIICTLLYVAVAAVLTGLVPYAELNVADPIAKGVDVVGLTWFSILIKIGALSGLTTVILVLLYGQTRILYTVAHDGLLPGLFAPGASSAADAIPQPDADRARGGRHRRAGADRRPWRTGQHRHAVRVRPGMRVRHLPAPQRFRSISSVSRARGSGGAGAGYPVLPAADGGPTADDLVATGDLAGDRIGDLFRLWAVTVAAARSRPGGVGVVGDA
jgi:hypothetical protein